MTDDRLADLNARLDAASPEDLAVVALDGIRATWPESGPPMEEGLEPTGSVDQAMRLAGRLLPLWSLSLEGTAGAPGGPWSCRLRTSGLRDDEEVIGIGRAATASLAIVVAVLRVRIMRARGYA